MLGRAIGLIVFVVGVAMLAAVFWLSWKIFQNPGFAETTATVVTANVIARLAGLIVQLAFLLSMCVAASLIASKGIQLYAAGDSPWLPHRKYQKPVSSPAASHPDD